MHSVRCPGLSIATGPGKAGPPNPRVSFQVQGWDQHLDTRVKGMHSEPVITFNVLIASGLSCEGDADCLNTESPCSSFSITHS
jgi:hypothetical protein